MVLSQDNKTNNFEPIRQYIKKSWTVLTRSMATLEQAARDTKVEAGELLPLYVSGAEDAKAIAAALRQKLPDQDPGRKLVVRSIPDDPASIQEDGLVYLPYPYVVSGTRYNEMYGWDSYFTVLGLVRDGEITLAKDVVNNCLYQVEHFGMVLNANRTYYLTRSHPPFLSAAALEVFRYTKDTAWLAQMLPLLRKYYHYWVTEPHLTESTSLSRYYDKCSQPAKEVLFGEQDHAGQTHYDRVREYFRTHETSDFDIGKYYDRQLDRLTEAFYTGDRAMRESGFDASMRFGPFSAQTADYNPVCLNALLYRMEMDVAAIYTLVLNAPVEASNWTLRAQSRAEAINRLMWNEREGLYFDYDFKQSKQSDYRFLSTFFPLWAGIATHRQAARIASNVMLFERQGGLMTSDRVTGCQWDAPYGFANLQLIAVQGLRRYGFDDIADRIAAKFLSTIVKDFALHRTIMEKYDVEKCSSDLGGGLKYGYMINDVGFAWTNAAFLVLYDELSDGARKQLINS